jgi:hypothetical protein
LLLASDAGLGRPRLGKVVRPRSALLGRFSRHPSLSINARDSPISGHLRILISRPGKHSAKSAGQGLLPSRQLDGLWSPATTGRRICGGHEIPEASGAPSTSYVAPSPGAGGFLLLRPVDEQIGYKFRVRRRRPHRPPDVEMLRAGPAAALLSAWRRSSVALPLSLAGCGRFH